MVNGLWKLIILTDFNDLKSNEKKTKSPVKNSADKILNCFLSDDYLFGLWLEFWAEKFRET